MRLPNSAHTSRPGGSTRSPQIAAQLGMTGTVAEVDQLVDECLDPEALGERGGLAMVSATPTGRAKTLEPEGLAYNVYNSYGGRMQTDTARQRLRALILDGTYPAGTRLTELEAAAVLGMSHTPVREAIRALAADGLVRPAGWGVAVVALDPSDLDHAYQVRAALEGLTAELAADRQRAGRIAPADLASVRGAAADAAAATAAGQLQEAVEHNRRFHRQIAELAGNPIALASLDRLWDQILVSTLQSLAAPARPARVAAQHEELLAAIANGRVVEAGRIARQHGLDTRASAHQKG